MSWWRPFLDWNDFLVVEWSLNVDFKTPILENGQEVGADQVWEEIKKIWDGLCSLWESEKKRRMFTHIKRFNQHVFPSTKEA